MNQMSTLIYMVSYMIHRSRFKKIWLGQHEDNCDGWSGPRLLALTIFQRLPFELKQGCTWKRDVQAAFADKLIINFKYHYELIINFLIFDNY